MSPETRTFTATCHCQLSTLSFTLPISPLPLPVHFCHCTICRHTHGTLCTMHVGIPAPSIDFSTFTEYRSSEKVVRWFCRACGAHMVDRAMGEGEGKGEGKWYVAAALVDAEEEVWKFGDSYFVGRTGCGGLAGVMGKVRGRKMGVWRERGGEVWVPPVQEKGKEDEHAGIGDWQDEKRGKEEELHLRCHCGSTHISVARSPNAAVFDTMDKTLVPKDKSKWCAAHDACDSCRLTSSSAIVSWLFPLRSCVSVYPDPSSPGKKIPYPENGLFGTAKSYSSSPGVTRTFCGTCGATVSYACEEREDMVDLATGLVVVEGEFGGEVKGVEGVKAEEWFEWRERVAFEEDAKWKGVIEGLKEGLRRAEGGEV